MIYLNLGAVKRADERDLLFGRLFGCLALTRSGRLLSDQKMAIRVFNHLVELLGTKVNHICITHLVSQYVVSCGSFPYHFIACMCVVGIGMD